MDYESMLKKARLEMPESVFEKERFEIPNVVGHLQGNKTIVSNFNQIVGVLGRTKEHVLKYLLKVLAAPGIIKNGRFIIGSKISASKINSAIRNYANEYVLCPECGKPETKIEKEHNQRVLRCLACGARNVISGRIE